MRPDAQRHGGYRLRVRYADHPRLSHAVKRPDAIRCKNEDSDKMFGVTFMGWMFTVTRTAVLIDPSGAW
jgi:hypothetical protein